ncbi:hypothetical protein F9U64_17885 [Gracilibacillus oryzae]|uniref:Lipoprotein n=1 Tax=Gracilibacillus oryzae TaxID=1672701 RepID=A0A7C8GR08_9BACI|nr:hypothetical protein [Gracilibacillus oryzae]KAB8127382.1 hypothetical protein F9U64_17885 [Gracilibacillus oryzae]
MEKFTMFFLAMVILLFAAGCTKNEEVLIKKQQIQLQELKDKVADLEDTISKQQKNLDNKKEFSYLNNFTKDELRAYNLFSKEKDVKHLSGFLPEKMVLIYLHSVVVDDVEAIYSLTYDDGMLPDLDNFRGSYYSEGFHLKEMHSTLDYRYYTSIKVKEDNKTENDAYVELTVSIGQYTSSIIYGLKKDSGIWKMDILHLMEN